MVSEAGTGEQSYFRSRYSATAFGIASLLIGTGLLYSIVTDSVDLLVGVLLTTIALTAISLYIVFRKDGVLTTENAVIGVFVLLALGLFFALSEYTALPTIVIIGAVIVVGVVVPNLLVNHTRLGNKQGGGYERE